jgi:hypothetical protein
MDDIPKISNVSLIKFLDDIPKFLSFSCELSLSACHLVNPEARFIVGQEA